MKKYADKRANLLYPKQKTLNDVLKNSLKKSLMYEKALKDNIRNYGLNNTIMI